MGIKLDQIFGIHERALELRSKRAALIANNIANADTPGFKARDIDFKAILADHGAMANGQLKMKGADRSHVNHLAVRSPMEGLLYRTPSQPAIDGNTVDANLEKAEYAKNSMDFMASFTFLNSRINSLKGALRGE